MPEELPFFTFYDTNILYLIYINNMIVMIVKMMALFYFLMRYICTTFLGSSLKVSGDIDYEQERTIVVTLRATDKSGLQLTKNVTVTVENVRHGPKIDLKLVQDYQCDSDTGVCIHYCLLSLISLT